MSDVANFLGDVVFLFQKKALLKTCTPQLQYRWFSLWPSRSAPSETTGSCGCWQRPFWLWVKKKTPKVFFFWQVWRTKTLKGVLFGGL